MRTEFRRTSDWSKLLVDAVHTPGVLSTAYHQFWNYSVGNQLLAIFECMHRGMQPGPINTFRGWLEMGRHVRKGEKAITLCMPVTVKRRSRRANANAILATPSQNPTRSEDPAQHDVDAPEAFTAFIYRARWFVLSQTDGVPYVPAELPAWSESRALLVLRIERIEFTHINGNCQGFARKRQVAVSPIAAQPHETLFHEIAHVVLGHTAEGSLEDHDRTPINEREVEAESVALICCESLGLPGAAECRGYIQHWLTGHAIPEKSAQRILKAADVVLKAGHPDSKKKAPSNSSNKRL